MSNPFATEAVQFLHSFKDRLENAVAFGVGGFFKEISMATPEHVDDDYFDIDSHQTRQAWTAGLDTEPTPPAGASNYGSEDAEWSVDKTFEAFNSGVHTRLFFVNPDEYILMLEFGGYMFQNRVNSTASGFSTQAPNGIVRVRLPLFDDYVKNSFDTILEGL